MSTEEETFDEGELVAKKVFIITAIGMVLFSGAVILFIL
jgi:hypothetical protein